MSKSRLERQAFLKTGHWLWAIAMLAMASNPLKPALSVEPGHSQASENPSHRCTVDSKLRYCDNGDGTVRDNRSGLVWLKDASCAALAASEDGMLAFREANNAAASLKDGICGLSDGSKAGDWRLPNDKEWKAMRDRAFQNPSFSSPDGTRKWEPGDIFTGIQPEGYWSSTPESDTSDYAWQARLFGGIVVLAGKNIPGYIWPVRNH